MKVYNIMQDKYDEYDRDHYYSFVKGPYATKEAAMKDIPKRGSGMGTSVSYYIEEVELKE